MSSTNTTYIANQTVVFRENQNIFLNITTNSSRIYILEKEANALQTLEQLKSRLYDPCIFQLNISPKTGRGTLKMNTIHLDMVMFMQTIYKLKSTSKNMKIYYSHHFMIPIPPVDVYPTFRIVYTLEFGVYNLFNFTIKKGWIQCKLENINILNHLYPLNIYNEDHFIGL